MNLVRIGELENDEKEAQLKSIYYTLNKQERFVFTKLMTGGWRLGVSQNLITKALSEHYNIDKAILAHRLMGNWTPDSTTFEQLIIEDDINDQLAKPYPFYLAHPLETEEVKQLPKAEHWQAEWKWDGIRGQIINRNGEVSIWSRGEELVTEKFPELAKMAGMLPSGTVLDGEILPFKNNEPLPFGVLQTRIGRKNITKSILNSAPVVFRTYDLLEIDGNDIRQKTLSERHELLKEYSGKRRCRQPAIRCTRKF